MGRLSAPRGAFWQTWGNKEFLQFCCPLVGRAGGSTHTARQGSWPLPRGLSPGLPAAPRPRPLTYHRLVSPVARPVEGPCLRPTVSEKAAMSSSQNILRLSFCTKGALICFTEKKAGIPLSFSDVPFEVAGVFQKPRVRFQ